MREILFRGRRKNGRWVYGSLIQTETYCCILESEEDTHPMDYPYLDGDLGTIDGNATPVIPETVGQYTGLSDKNGNKIFEGDIVRIYLFGGVEIGQITYSEISCRFKFADKYGSTYGFDDTCTFEIIGNIHDNPELLKGGAE